MPGRFTGEAWSLVNATKPGFPVQLTVFQTALPRSVSLAGGGSTALPFSFDVPASVEDGTQTCVQTLASRHRSAFDTLGQHFLFCLTKGPYGFTAVPGSQKPDTVNRRRPAAPGRRP
jgi:hypothetical protein